MKWHTLSLLFIACIFQNSFAQTWRYATGIVVDAEYGDPISGAHVLVQHSNEGVVTDSNGFFTLELYAGEDTLVVRHPGFATQQASVRPDTMRIELVYEMGLDTVAVVTPETYEETYQIVRNERSFGRTPHRIQKTREDNWNTEDYSPIEENGERDVLSSPLSTFSIDVDRASYSNVRRFLNEGQLPPRDAVRVEEMINYFSYQYPLPERDGPPFSVYTELADCPWNENRKLLHIGLQGKIISREELTPSNLVFLMDVSGSMSAQNKLPLAKQAMRLLVEQLRPEDRVAIVVYAGAAGLVLPSTPGTDKQAILQAIDRMEAGGSTAGGAGIQLAYQTAREYFIEGGNNRVILTTDGDFNVGVSSDGGLTQLIEEKRKTGIFLSVLGFGMGNYKDNKLELLADKGNGNYAYIDNLEEAKKVFVEELPGTLYTIAKDVKIQLEFNPGLVRTYRLVGYENRLLNTEDFADDAKDAGEIGAGHTVTALYELEMAPVQPAQASLRYQQPGLTKVARKGQELGFLQLRYKLPEEEDSQLLSVAIENRLNRFAKATNDFQFAAAVAAFGMLLRESPFNKQLGFPEIRRLAKEAIRGDPNGYRKEFLELVERAERLAGTSVD
ncbi:MAG: von Willebrand factor type A domain-containing protein [Phaeodactylibacter sp.]|nr:von Willebrand factor type A domain-containing protein [Phaeodactylibacter sp.]MCB9293326.1 von Willebrand factor type A domain-containing protein [Lewinellaceae bacterium]